MVVKVSTMLPLGTIAPDFGLPDTKGNVVSLSDFEEAPALLVIFMCNHCPYVKHILHGMVDLVKGWQKEGVAVVGISSNDVAAFPEDRPEMMAEVAEAAGFSFPYLYDQTQEVAKAYRAACTPDFFLFDKDRRLAYRGQMDNSRPGNDVPVTGADLRDAINAVVQAKPVSKSQTPSMGCNIKWKPGNEPDYA